MAESLFEPPSPRLPAYLGIAQSVRGAIARGTLRGADWLPSVRELALRFRVHRNTILASLAELVAEGWIAAYPRKGYRVLETPPEGAARAPAPRTASAPPHAWRLRTPPPTPAAETPPPRHAFWSGVPDLRPFPHAELKTLYADLLRKRPEKLLLAGEPAGYGPLLEEIRTYARRTRNLQDREFFVTHGSQEGIFLASLLLLRPGDGVAVERLGYPAARDAFRMAGASIHPVPVDRDGLDVDALEKTLRRRRIRLIHVTPLHQFPTTVTLSLGRRARLYELAAKYGVPILEDDYDHEFHYDCQPLEPLAARDPHGLVISLATFSKVLFPGARLGFMAVPPGLKRPLDDLRRIVTGSASVLPQAVLAKWMAAGGFERHVRRMKRIYHARRDFVVERLAATPDTGLAWSDPRGGLALWIETDQDSDRLARAAAKLGVAVSPESAFDSAGRSGRGFRLGYSNQNLAELGTGLDLLLRAIRRK